MPRRRSAEPQVEEVQSHNNRRSARLAAKDDETVSPVKTPSKKRVSQKFNGKTKSDEEPLKKVARVDEVPKNNDSDIADYDVVHTDSVPDADSEEVKKAIAAQGDDGSLLVGFVQIDKDETPAADSAEVLAAASKGALQLDDSKDNSTLSQNGAVNSNIEETENPLIEEPTVAEVVRPLENSVATSNVSTAEACVTVTHENSELAKAVVSEHDVVSEPVDANGDIKISTS